MMTKIISLKIMMTMTYIGLIIYLTHCSSCFTYNLFNPYKTPMKYCCFNFTNGKLAWNGYVICPRPHSCQVVELLTLLPHHPDSVPSESMILSNTNI